MALNEIDEIYGGAILDHCRNPRNRDKLLDADVDGRAVNPFCGDEVEIQLEFDGCRVSAVGVQAEGCSINRATGSILSEVIAGRTMVDVMDIVDQFKGVFSGSDRIEGELAGLEGLESLVVLKQHPVRIKCALLTFSALEEAFGR